MSLEIELLGVRGSLPTPYFPIVLEEHIEALMAAYSQSALSKVGDYKSFLEKLPAHLKGGYGGNTTCVRVHNGSDIVIIDGGSGIRNSLKSLLESPDLNLDPTIHILMTHFHWDHIIGLPFFTPLFMRGKKIKFYAVQNNFEQFIKMIFTKPFFPVEFNSLAADISFHQLQPRTKNRIGKLEVSPYLLDHPDECWGFKIEQKGRTFAHCVDTEATRTSREQLGHDLPLYQNVDLMLFDAQYSIQEAKEKVNWGHSAAAPGLEIAFREGIKKIVLTHHDPWASDDQIAGVYMEAFQHFESLDLVRLEKKEQAKTICQIGIEGQKITV